MKNEFQNLLITFIKEQNDVKRQELQQSLTKLIKDMKLSFGNSEAELMAKQHLLFEINSYAISPNDVSKSLLITQLTILPSIIVE